MTARAGGPRDLVTVESVLALFWAVVTISSASSAQSSLWSMAYYVMAGAMTAAVLAEAVAAHRHGRASDQYAIASAIEQDVFTALLIVQIGENLATHQNPALSVACLALLLYLRRNRRNGRRLLRKLLGEKSKALLEKLAGRQPLPVPVPGR